MNEWKSSVLIRVRIEHPIPITNDYMKRGWWQTNRNRILGNLSSHFPFDLEDGSALESRWQAWQWVHSTSCEIGRSSSFLPLSHFSFTPLSAKRQCKPLLTSLNGFTRDRPHTLYFDTRNWQYRIEMEFEAILRWPYSQISTSEPEAWLQELEAQERQQPWSQNRDS